MNTAPRSPHAEFVAQAWKDDALHLSDKQVYEAEVIDVEGNGCETIVLEFATDAEAIACCGSCLKSKPGRQIKLYRVPFVNESHMPSCQLWPDDVHLVACIDGQKD